MIGLKTSRRLVSSGREAGVRKLRKLGAVAGTRRTLGVSGFFTFLLPCSRRRWGGAGARRTTGLRCWNCGVRCGAWCVARGGPGEREARHHGTRQLRPRVWGEAETESEWPGPGLNSFCYRQLRPNTRGTKNMKSVLNSRCLRLFF